MTRSVTAAQNENESQRSREADNKKDVSHKKKVEKASSSISKTPGTTSEKKNNVKIAGEIPAMKKEEKKGGWVYKSAPLPLLAGVKD